MKRLKGSNVWRAVVLSSLLQFSGAPVARATLVQVPLSTLDVTEGDADVRQLASGLIEVSAPLFRATELHARSNGAQLVFGYRGEVPNPQPTGSGENRVQIGQKLLSVDPCNLVYVMWRLFPDESIVVSAKRNPGTTSAQCGNQGYTNIVPDAFPARATKAATAVPALLTARNGATRTLRSQYNSQNRVLRVSVDNQIIWQGRLPSDLVHGLSGPSGLRTDNGVFRFRFYTDK